MEKLDNFKGILEQFMKKSNDFKRIFDSTSPQTEAPPEPWDKKLDEFEKIIFTKAIRPDKVVPGVQNWIEKIMGNSSYIFICLIDRSGRDQRRMMA